MLERKLLITVWDSGRPVEVLVAAFQIRPLSNNPEEAYSTIYAALIGQSFDTTRSFVYETTCEYLSVAVELCFTIFYKQYFIKYK